MTQLAADAGHMPDLLRRTCEEAIRFLSGLADRAVNNRQFVAPAARLPERGIGAAAAFDAFLSGYGSALTASAGPRYFGFVTGGSTPAAIAGDWLTSAYDQNASEGSSAAACQLERAAMTMFRELLGLPAIFDGRFVTGATMSNFVGLAIARQWWGEQLETNVADRGLGGLPALAVLSGTPHACIAKSLSMLGLGRHSLHRVPTLPGREAVDVEALNQALAALSGRPCVVVGNAGIVNTGDFDDIAAIAALRRVHPFYLHVDAAFGGFAACSPRLRPLVAGWEDADSIAIDGHKWLNVPYDSGIQLSRHLPLQRDVFQNTVAAYLGEPNDVDALHLPRRIHAGCGRSRRGSG
jgi:glutamate/tyrosine decarboxylase-like PLP-dependent enzyme